MSLEKNVKEIVCVSLCSAKKAHKSPEWLLDFCFKNAKDDKKWPI